MLASGLVGGLLVGAIEGLGIYISNKMQQGQRQDIDYEVEGNAALPRNVRAIPPPSGVFESHVNLLAGTGGGRDKTHSSHNNSDSMMRSPYESPVYFGRNVFGTQWSTITMLELIRNRNK